jgi:hypothetical protein
MMAGPAGASAGSRRKNDVGRNVACFQVVKNASTGDASGCGGHGNGTAGATSESGVSKFWSIRPPKV